MFFYNLIRSGNDIATILIVALAFILAVVFSIVIHENCHGLVALLNGDKTAKEKGRLTLNPLAHFDPIGIVMFLLVGFGWAKPVPVDSRNFKNYRIGMITVSLAGVVANLLLAGIGMLLLYLLIPILINYMIAESAFVRVIEQLVLYLLIYGIQINFLLAAFNLLPIYPLDGYNLVNTLLPRNTRYQEFMIKYGFIILLGLILLGQLGDVLGFPYLDIFGLYSDWISDLINKIMVAGYLR